MAHDAHDWERQHLGGAIFPKKKALQSKAEPLISQATGKKIGCVQHDCDECQAFAAALSEAIAEAEGMIRSERLGGNIVKESWWRGKLTGLRAAQARIKTPNRY